MRYEAFASRSWSWWLHQRQSIRSSFVLSREVRRPSNPDLGFALFIAPRASYVAAKFPSVLK